MPGGHRRNAANRTGPTGRSGGAGVNSASNINGRSNSGERVIGSGADDKKPDETYGVRGSALAPKHVPIPVIPVDGQLTFEALSLVVSIVAASLQLLNLYRTVWWLPHSYNDYSMVSFYRLLLYYVYKSIVLNCILKEIKRYRRVCFRIFI